LGVGETVNMLNSNSLQKNKLSLVFLVELFLLAGILFFNGAFEAEAARGLTVTPNSHDFGDVDVGNSANRTFTITNIGDNGNLNGSVSGLSGDFSCTKNCAYTLTPGQSRSVKIRYTPSGAGFTSATLNFSSSFPGWTVYKTINIATDGACNDYGAPDTPPASLGHGNAQRSCSESELGDRWDSACTSGGGLYDQWECKNLSQTNINRDVSGTGIVPPPPIVVTAELLPDTDTILIGNSTNLTWTSTNANSCRIDDLTSNIAYTSLGANGNRDFSPIVDTDYRLVCRNGANTSAPDISEIFVNNPGDPVINNLTSTQVVDYGMSATVTWDVSGPPSTVCLSNGPGWNGGVSLSGSTESALLFDNAVFRLTCNNGVGGPDVISTANTFVRPLVNLWIMNEVSPLEYGRDTTEVRWNVLGPAVLCTGSGNPLWNGPKIPGGGMNQGPEVIGPFTTNTALTLTCSNGNGDSGSDSEFIEIYPRIISFSVTNPVIEGTNSNHVWEVLGPGVSCSGTTLLGDDGGWSGGGKNASDSELVGPIFVGSTYRLICTNSTGELVQETRTLNVSKPNLSLTAQPIQVLKGKTSALNWDTEYVVPGTCLLTEPKSDLTLVVSDDGSYETTQIETSKTYTLTCDLLSANGGTIDGSVTISAFTTVFKEE